MGTGAGEMPQALKTLTTHIERHGLKSPAASQKLTGYGVPALRKCHPGAGGGGWGVYGRENCQSLQAASLDAGSVTDSLNS